MFLTYGSNMLHFGNVKGSIAHILLLLTCERLPGLTQRVSEFEKGMPQFLNSDLVRALAKHECVGSCQNGRRKRRLTPLSKPLVGEGSQFKRRARTVKFCHRASFR